MSEVQETQEEEVANPYNMRKEYSDEQDAPFQSADGVYHEPSQATRKAPDEENANYKKRYDDLKKHYDSKINEFKQKEQELQAEARMTQQVEQAVRHEDNTEAELANEYVEQPAEALEPARTSALDEREARVARKEAEQTLASAHPDFADIRQSEEFHGWAKAQPEAIQDWVYNNPDNVGLAVKAIDLYKLENGLQTSQGTVAKSQASTKASAADMVSTKTKSIDAKEAKVWSQREIAALSMAQYDKYEKEIDAAIMEGRVVA
jgi:hypothetical protein